MDRQIADDDAALFAAARVARDFAQLPGAPSPDWCQKAAAALADAAAQSRAWIAVVRSGGSGALSIERAGYAGVPSDDGASADESARQLRVLARGVMASLETPVRPAVHSIAELAARADASPQVSRLRRHGSILAGVSPVGQPARDGRTMTLLAFWEPDPGEPAGPLTARDLRRILRSAMPVLSDRLRLALRGADERAPWLSEREQRVLELLTRGMSVPEVADLLGRSQHTVHDYVKSLHRKLGTSTRGGLVARALGHGGNPSARPAGRSIPIARPMLAFRTDGRTAFVDHSLA